MPIAKKLLVSNCRPSANSGRSLNRLEGMGNNPNSKLLGGWLIPLDPFRRVLSHLRNPVKHWELLAVWEWLRYSRGKVNRIQKIKVGRH